jgi:hypothetical protein
MLNTTTPVPLNSHQCRAPTFASGSRFVFQSSLRDSRDWGFGPRVKTRGYCQESLRDRSGQRLGGSRKRNLRGLRTSAFRPRFSSQNSLAGVPRTGVFNRELTQMDANT